MTETSAFDNKVLDHRALDHRALDHRALDHTALDATALDATALDAVVAEHLAAVNACDEAAIMATFADDEPWSTTRTGSSGAPRPSAAGWPGRWSAIG